MDNFLRDIINKTLLPAIETLSPDGVEKFSWGNDTWYLGQLPSDAYVIWNDLDGVQDIQTFGDRNDAVNQIIEEATREYAYHYEETLSENNLDVDLTRIYDGHENIIGFTLSCDSDGHSYGNDVTFGQDP